MVCSFFVAIFPTKVRANWSIDWSWCNVTMFIETSWNWISTNSSNWTINIFMDKHFCSKIDNNSCSVQIFLNKSLIVNKCVSWKVVFDTTSSSSIIFKCIFNFFVNSIRIHCVNTINRVGAICNVCVCVIFNKCIIEEQILCCCCNNKRMFVVCIFSLQSFSWNICWLKRTHDNNPTNKFVTIGCCCNIWSRFSFLYIECTEILIVFNSNSLVIRHISNIANCFKTIEDEFAISILACWIIMISDINWTSVKMSNQNNSFTINVVKVAENVEIKASHVNQIIFINIVSFFVWMFFACFKRIICFFVSLSIIANCIIVCWERTQTIKSPTSEFVTINNWIRNNKWNIISCNSWFCGNHKRWVFTNNIAFIIYILVNNVIFVCFPKSCEHNSCIVNRCQVLKACDVKIGDFNHAIWCWNLNQVIFIFTNLDCLKQVCTFNSPTSKVITIRSLWRISDNKTLTKNTSSSISVISSPITSIW